VAKLVLERILGHGARTVTLPRPTA
jgi:hypothetical protein